MPTCELCDGESFYDQNGKFYCANCGTQSQDMQVEVQQEIDMDVTQVRKLQVRDRGKRKGRKRKSYDIGKPWVSYEGFQCLIKAQVKALIDMGFDEKLQNVVGQIWFRYLQEIEVAFCENEPTTISLNAKKMTGRSKNLGTLPPSVQKKRNPKMAMLPDLHEDEQMLLKEEEFYEEDMPTFLKVEEDDDITMEADIRRRLSDNNQSSSSEDEVKPKTPDVVGSCGSFKVQQNRDMPLFMTMTQPHTLCFVYLGLVYLEEPVLLNDLIRWAREGSLPYHKASVVFPSEMKFAGTDRKIFNKQACPGVKSSYDLTRKIASCLNLDLTYTQENCKLLLVSLTVDLDFSEGVQRISGYLLDVLKLPDQSSELTTEPVDAQLMAIIVIAAKLIYYLDGCKEFEDKIRTTLLEKLDIPTVEPWKGWVTRTMMKAKMKLHNGIPHYEEDLNYINDISVYADYVTKDVFKSFASRPTSRPYHFHYPSFRKGFNEQAIEQYYNTFSSLAESLNEHVKLEDIKRVPSSFPLSISHVGEIISVSTAGLNQCDIVTNSSAKIGDVNKMQNDAIDKTPNIDDDKIKDKNVDIKRNDITDKTLNTLDNEVTDEKVKRIQNQNIQDETSQMLEDLPSLSQCNDGESRDHYEGYVLYPDWSNQQEWHDSYKYLMKILSRRVELSEIELQSCVRTLELKIFNAEIKRQLNELISL
ncbi:uncharacterized protein LOC130621916 [Hydractinia symbiolongicarpus]|uniref:uncharacterized protein LOC130621916 n=1 Tax=Hydractinia symbiolongicarpus TaxID=13093 RepID=UPI00254AA22F|nr:uncharacterized protein LOC130621916 [Hydractinia symbiolongicarpus]